MESLSLNGIFTNKPKTANMFSTLESCYPFLLCFPYFLILKYILYRKSSFHTQKMW